MLRDEDGNEHPLVSSEFALLKAFAENPKRVLSRERLLDLAEARDREAFDRAIDVRITRIRRKIEPDPAHPTVIRTVRGAGYLFSPRRQRYGLSPGVCAGTTSVRQVADKAAHDWLHSLIKHALPPNLKKAAMERSFKKEVELLRLGDGDVFRGEGILAVTKALLQSGVSYVGGYQGAPVSHLLDVMVEAEDLLAELGVHVETCTNEASAAAMLGASINYPLRGAVTWKSIVGTNVAADALSNLSSPGVVGGVMIILGEDYGEGASVIQERSYAYALKSSMWLLDPRPDLPTIVRMVEKGFELSEASHAPVMMELRIRACHVTGEFATKNNKRAAFSGRNRIPGPPRFEYDRLAHPPALFVHERLKVEDRLPAACAFIREHKLNEFIAGDLADIGIIVCGGLTSGVLRALARLELAEIDGTSRVPIYVLNCVYPLVPEEVREFCAGKRAVLVVEEGSPDYIEQQINVELRRADIQTRVHGKGVLPKTGDYTSDVLLNGLAAFLREARPAGIDADAITARVQGMLAHKPAAAASLGDMPVRPPTFCTGCPERPVFSAIKLMQRELGPDAHLGRHRLPRVRDLRAVQHGQFHSRLRHVARERGGGDAQSRPPPDRDHGRRRLLAQRPDHRRDVEPVQQGRRRADHYAERLRLRHRPAIPAVVEREPPGRGARHGHRDDAARARRHLDAQGAHLWRGEDDRYAEGSDAHRRTRPQGHHRRWRMPARAPAPCARRGCREAQARRARHQDALRRRRRDLHRRPFLHSVVGVPVADGEAQSRSAAHRSGRDGDRELRRLRPVRRGRACGGAVSVVLPRRGGAQSGDGGTGCCTLSARA